MNWKAKIPKRLGLTDKLKLQIEGEIKVPNPGYTADIERSKNPIDKEYLNLEVKLIDPPSDNVYPQVIANYKIESTILLKLSDKKHIDLKAIDESSVIIIDRGEHLFVPVEIEK